LRKRWKEKVSYAESNKEITLDVAFALDELGYNTDLAAVPGNERVTERELSVQRPKSASRNAINVMGNLIMYNY
jgi:hypothetical protein